MHHDAFRPLRLLLAVHYRVIAACPSITLIVRLLLLVHRFLLATCKTHEPARAVLRVHVPILNLCEVEEVVEAELRLSVPRGPFTHHASKVLEAYWS